MVVGSLEEPTQHLVGHWSDRTGLLASPENPSLIKKIERTAATTRSKRDRSLSRDIGRTPSYIDINVSTKKRAEFYPGPDGINEGKKNKHPSRDYSSGLPSEISSSFGGLSCLLSSSRCSSPISSMAL